MALWPQVLPGAATTVFTAGADGECWVGARAGDDENHPGLKYGARARGW
jgi:hypothetical protein